MKRLGLICISVLLFLYLANYLYLSRRGYAEARKVGMEGFYYSKMPDNDSSETIYQFHRNNRYLKMLYWPANKLDCLLGTGREAVTPSSFGAYHKDSKDVPEPNDSRDPVMHNLGPGQQPKK
ncbi:MAG: hypothetical protein ACJ8FY_28285 [Gemmataceae bacterium]